MQNAVSACGCDSGYKNNILDQLTGEIYKMHKWKENYYNNGKEFIPQKIQATSCSRKF